MSQSITIKMKDGKVREFQEKGRPGGSYTIRVQCEPGFVVITDEWDYRTYIPSSEIEEITTKEHTRW